MNRPILILNIIVSGGSVKMYGQMSVDSIIHQTSKIFEILVVNDR